MKNDLDRMLEARMYYYEAEDEEIQEMLIKEEKEALNDLPEDFVKYFMSNFQFHDHMIAEFNWDRVNHELKLWLYEGCSFFNNGYDREKAIVLTYKGVQKCQISWEGSDEDVNYAKIPGQEPEMYTMFFRYGKEYKRKREKCPFECVIRMFGIEKFRIVFTGLTLELNKSEGIADHLKSDQIVFFNPAM